MIINTYDDFNIKKMSQINDHVVLVQYKSKNNKKTMYEIINTKGESEQRVRLYEETIKKILQEMR